VSLPRGIVVAEQDVGKGAPGFLAAMRHVAIAGMLFFSQVIAYGKLLMRHDDGFGISRINCWMRFLGRFQRDRVLSIPPLPSLFGGAYSPSRAAGRMVSHEDNGHVDAWPHDSRAIGVIGA